MIGWVILLGLIAISAATLWALGVRRGMLQAAGAALLFGAAGYALQGRPGLPGSPGRSSEAANVIPLTEARHAFYGSFTGEESWLRMSEALARSGESEDSVNILTNAVHRYPGNAQLWVGLGNALVDHAHGLTPPAELAYERAIAISPGYPGPRFFRDLALARSGQGEAAFRDLVQLIREHPKASWRPMAEQLAIAIALGGPGGRRRGPQAATGS
jgi:cytochrome c-type biogenesis protein CcmH